jgi:hypothetical protein
MAYMVTYTLINIIASKLLPELNFLEIRFLLILQVLFTTLVIAIATNAIQLTPYAPIDQTLIKYELLPLEKNVAWTVTYPQLHKFLITIYNSLNFCMIAIPLLLSVLNKAKEVNQFCIFLLYSVSVGFVFYYFYPSCGPASILNPSLFLDVQHANHIKFWEIHHYQTPSTFKGGLIAFPSYHVIWAWACTRSFKNISKKLYTIMFIWFVILTMSCVLLGWHYSVDIIGSLVLILVLEKLLGTKKTQDNLGN